MLDLKQIPYVSKFLPLTFAILLTACGGGGGSESAGNESDPETNNTIALSGSAVKGPLANAIVNVYRVDTARDDLQGALVDTGSSNSAAQFSGVTLNPDNAPYLLVVTSDSDTVDITTGLAPSITTLKTIISSDALNATSNPGLAIFATPLTSMAVEILSASEDIATDNFSAELENAENQVKTALGFGLDTSIDLFTTPPILTELTDTVDEQEEVAEYRLAIEALSAVLVEISEETTADDSADDVLEALALDLADGELDGNSETDAIAELTGYDVSDLDDTDVSSLNIPGTEISVNDIEEVLDSDTEVTGVDQNLSDSVDVSGVPPVLSADRDLDGVADSDDNCPDISNSDQTNINGNDVGDACDAAPVISSSINASVNEDSSVGIDLSQNVSDLDNTLDQLAFRVNGEAQDGSVFTFSPDANFNGQTSFSYSVSDGVSEAAGTVSVTVTPQNDPGSLNVEGTAEQGQTLTASVTDVDGFSESGVNYQWLADGEAIVGQTSVSLTLGQDQVGSAISVSASYVDLGQTLESLESNATVLVANINDAPTGSVTISGNSRVGETVTANALIEDLDGLGEISYSWTSGGIPVSSEVSYTLLAEDLSLELVVTATYQDGFQNEESVSSDPMTVLAALSDEADGLVGIWAGDVADDEFGNTLFFLNDGDYYAIQREEIDGFVGYEYGMFNFDEDSISITTIDNNDGQAILCESEAGQGCDEFSVPASLLEDRLTLTVSNENLAYDRQVLSSGAIEGIWEGSDEPIAFMFLPNGEYYAVQRESGSGVSGYEFGTYTFGINSGSITVSTFDNNDGSELFCTADEDMETGCTGQTFDATIENGSLTLELDNRTVTLLNRTSTQ